MVYPSKAITEMGKAIIKLAIKWSARENHIIQAGIGANNAAMNKKMINFNGKNPRNKMV